MKIVGARGYGTELRERIVQFVNEGHAPGAAAAHFKVHVQTVQQYLEKAAQGTLGVVGKPTGRPFQLTAIREAHLLKQLDEYRDATLVEHAQMLEEATGLHVSFETVDRAFRRHNITHKKTLVARERSEERRAAFLNDLAPYLNEPLRLVFVDESGFNTAMARGRSSAPSHLRAVDVVPRNHGRKYTLVCAVSLVGPTAPLVLDGPRTGLVFGWYVREHLCLALVKGQVVIIDNLSSHRRPMVRTLTQAAGCTLLYLCAYNPDFNPIELFFSKLKALVRGAAWRTVDTLLEGIGTAIITVTRAHLAHWFKYAHPSVLL